MNNKIQRRLGYGRGKEMQTFDDDLEVLRVTIGTSRRPRRSELNGDSDTVVIRPNRMHAVYRCGLLLQLYSVVRVSAERKREPCKNGWTDPAAVWVVAPGGPKEPRAQFTKYPTTILRLSCDTAKVTIDLRRTANLQNILQREQDFS